MVIGIDGSRAFLKKRTGIEEYSYQVIKHLVGNLNGHQVVLYLRKNQEVDFELPENWNVKKINCVRLWTQVGLSWEMLRRPVNVLFIPAHTVPIIHPAKTVVTMHGLEYEFCPMAYSFWERLYMRATIKKSCLWSSSIISVSNNTKADLIKLYGVKDEKVQVVYEGYDNFQFPISNFQSNLNDQILNRKYLLFIGRIEERKNIVKVIEAFEILKDKYDLTHKLVLAGKPGYGYAYIKNKLQQSKYKNDIVELGYVSDEEKFDLLKKADCFVFATQYEGFGIPILEAQSSGCPVVASNNSSIPEVANESALLVDPDKSEEIAEAIYRIVSNESQKNDIIAKGLENVKRFSWDKCSEEIAEILKK